MYFDLIYFWGMFIILVLVGKVDGLVGDVICDIFIVFMEVIDLVGVGLMCLLDYYESNVIGVSYVVLLLV